MSIPKREDPDAKLMAGCVTFGLLSIGFFFITLWPFFVFSETYRLEILVKAIGLALVPAMLLGAIASRRFGLAGSGSFLAGTLTFGVFFFLRHHPMLAGANVPDKPQFDYPHSFIYLIPVIAFLVACFIVAISPSKITEG